VIGYACLDLRVFPWRVRFPAFDAHAHGRPEFIDRPAAIRAAKLGLPNCHRPDRPGSYEVTPCRRYDGADGSYVEDSAFGPVAAVVPVSFDQRPEDWPYGPAVYFASGAGDRVKIGWAARPVLARLRELRTAAPDARLLAAIVCDDPGVERQIHSKTGRGDRKREWHARESAIGWYLALLKAGYRPLLRWATEHPVDQDRALAALDREPAAVDLGAGEG
jgi:hypothetical protein